MGFVRFTTIKRRTLMKKPVLFNRIKALILSTALIVATSFIPSITASATNSTPDSMAEFLSSNRNLGRLTIDLSQGDYVLNFDDSNQWIYWSIVNSSNWALDSRPGLDFDNDTIIDMYYEYDSASTSMLLQASPNTHIPASSHIIISLNDADSYNPGMATYFIQAGYTMYSSIEIILKLDGGNGGNNGAESYGKSLNNLVNDISNGSGTIVFKEGNALPKKVMKALAANPNATLNFVFEHDGVKYDILIPGKEFAKYYDESIEWYGHLWLSGHFGNRAK